MRKWLIRVFVVALLVAAGYILRDDLFAPQPVVVSTIAVNRGTVESTVTNSKGGTVRARRRANLSTEIGGRVVAIPLREGEPASRGDLLLQLDDSSQQARLELSRRELEAIDAQREQACLAAAQAARELQRNQSLAERQIISENLLDRLQSTAETTRRGLRGSPGRDRCSEGGRRRGNDGARQGEAGGAVRRHHRRDQHRVR